MKTTEIFALCLIITIVSFLGFVVENVWLSITKGFIDNRNMTLPFLLGYGIAIVLIYILFGTPGQLKILGFDTGIKSTFAQTVIYYFAVIVCVSVGEIALGTFVEKTCGIIWWDYTRLPMHITRYTSVPTSMAFSMGITVFMRRFFTPLMHRFMQMDFDNLRFFALSFMTLLGVDFIVSAIKVAMTREMKSTWKIDTTHTRAYRFLHS